MPPELLGFIDQGPRQVDHFSADIWCLAETVFQVLTNRGTFDTYGTLMRYVTGRVEFPSEALYEAKVSDQCIRFIQNLMAPSPVNRPSSEQAIKHPWIVIEDDNESDNSNFRGSQEAYVVPMHAPGDDITQPDIHWTTDIDTANVESLSGIQPGAEEQGSRNTSQRPLPTRQEVITEESAAMNSERRYVLVSNDYEDQDQDKDKNRIKSSQNLTSDLFFPDHSTSNLTQASLDLEDERMRKGLNKRGSSQDGRRSVYTFFYDPAEESEDTQSASEVETEDIALTRRRIRRWGHRIPEEFLSRRVLSELAYRYELSEKVRLFELCDLAGVLIILTHTEQPHNSAQRCERRRHRRPGHAQPDQAHEEPTGQESVC